jgi:putative DNA primase/helicase
VTGQQIEAAPTTIEPRQVELGAFLADTFPEADPAASESSADGAGNDLDDATLLGRARLATNGERFRQLYDEGDWQGAGYPSQSEADLALCCLLTWWTNRDSARVDRLFRGSKLMRTKWDTRRGDSTYGADTIKKAMALVAGGYTEKVPSNTTDWATPSPLTAGATTETPTSTRPAYRCSDTGNAERFRDKHRHHVRYCPEWRSWVYFDGRRWVEDVGGIIVDQLMKDTLFGLYDESKRMDEDDAQKLRKWAATCESAGKRSAALELARSEMPVYAREFDTNPYILNCPNGTLDLRTGQLRLARAEDYCTKVTAAEYVEGAQDATWTTFLLEKFPDIATRDWAQRLAGCILLGIRTEDIMVNPYGPSRTGKTTFCESLRRMLGDYATSVQADTFMVSRRDNGGAANRPDLARLQGVRLVVSAEAEEHQRLDEGLVKQITGGDPITAAAKYKDPVTFVPEFLWMLYGNHLVKVRDDEPAIWTRIRVLPFDVAVEKGQEDPRIKEYLINNPKAHAAILAWAVEGLARYQDEGLKVVPEQIRRATEGYRNAMNALSAFIGEWCVLDPNAKVETPALRLAYVRWCEEQRVILKARLNLTEMAERLRGLDCLEGKSGSTRWWKGIRLKTPAERGEL